MTKRIYVGKLSPKTTNEKLLQHFSKVGEVISAKVNTGINPNQNAGYGYVVMANDKETNEAITKLNNSELDGNHIRVIEAHTIDQERKIMSNWRSFNRKRRG